MDKINAMKFDALYLLSLLLFLAWFVGYIFFDIGGTFHLMFLFSVVVLIYKLIKDNTSNTNI